MQQPQRSPRTNLATRLYYGSGSIAFGVKDNAFAYFLLIYYNQVLGLSATAADERGNPNESGRENRP